jgi:hypothetical protein
MGYSQLPTHGFGDGVQMPNCAVIGVQAESWDRPDDLTYVFKLRRGVMYQNQLPVSGRALVADDSIKSFERKISESV